MNNKSKEINEQIKFGLDAINAEKTIEITLKDFMLIYKTFAEFNRFFHQSKHYPTIEDIEIYLGNKDAGAFSIISEIYYDILPKYLPPEIDNQLGEENDPFRISKPPYYYHVKSDESIDDGTQNVTDRKSFYEFAQNLLKEYQKDGETWEAQRIDGFIEGIASYAEDIDGYYKNMKFDTTAETPTWRIFAQILKGATIYE